MGGQRVFSVTRPNYLDKINADLAPQGLEIDRMGQDAPNPLQGCRQGLVRLLLGQALVDLVHLLPGQLRLPDTLLGESDPRQGLLLQRFLGDLGPGQGVRVALVWRAEVADLRRDAWTGTTIDGRGVRILAVGPSIPS
jgi:hypothetical protein